MAVWNVQRRICLYIQQYMTGQTRNKCGKIKIIVTNNLLHFIYRVQNDAVSPLSLQDLVVCVIIGQCNSMPE